jgi:hypothetical protein
VSHSQGSVMTDEQAMAAQEEAPETDELEVAYQDGVAHAEGKLRPVVSGLVAACRAALLWHSGSPWDQTKHEEWQRLVGRPDATTKALCDRIRLALAAAGVEEPESPTPNEDPDAIPF